MIHLVIDRSSLFHSIHSFILLNCSWKVVFCGILLFILFISFFNFKKLSYSICKCSHRPPQSAPRDVPALLKRSAMLVQDDVWTVSQGRAILAQVVAPRRSLARRGAPRFVGNSQDYNISREKPLYCAQWPFLFNERASRSVYLHFPVTRPEGSR